MRVLVTGANGFLGRQILAELKSQGYTPLAFVRGAQSAKQLQDNGFECVVGTLDSPSDLYNALENAPAIIHAAGGGKASEPQSFLKNNGITTQQLLEAASDVEEQGTAQQHQRAELEGCPASVGQRNGFRFIHRHSFGLTAQLSERSQTRAPSGKLASRAISRVIALTGSSEPGTVAVPERRMATLP